MSFLQHHFRSLSIKKKIRIILICCVLLLVFTNSLSLLLLSKRHEKVLSDTVYENLLYASKQLNNTLDITGNLADAILADSVIQSELPLYNSSYTSPSEKNSCKITFTMCWEAICSTIIQRILPTFPFCPKTM